MEGERERWSDREREGVNEFEGVIANVVYFVVDVTVLKLF